jgi:RimJ/RimL family protein N-acetyltransferase
MADGSSPSRAAAAPQLEGERVRLRPLTDDDVPLLARLLNDPDVRYWTHLSEDTEEMLTLEAHRERYERMRDDQNQLCWCIETADGEPIGELGLLDIRLPHGRAELGISIDKAFWSRGYGTEAIRLVLRYAFGDLALRRVSLITDEDNQRGIRCYEKCGFVREGLLRAHRLRHGESLNMLTMGVLREEFTGD